MDQSESRAGDVVVFGGFERFGDSLRDRGFARAEIAAQEHQSRWTQLAGEFAPEFDRLFGGTRDEFRGDHPQT